MVEQSRESLEAADQGSSATDENEFITIDDFMKVDLRIARIARSRTGPPSRAHAGDLVGRQVIVVANLKPRKMRFGTSEGMVLAAGPGGEDIFLLSPDSGAEPGMRVK